MELSTATTKKIALLIVFSALVFLISINFISILTFILYVLGVFTPLILGFCIAFILNVFMKGIEMKWDKYIKIETKLKRPISLILTFLLVTLVICIFIFLIVPQISESISSIVEMLPTYLQSLENTITNFVGKYHIYFIDISSLDVNLENIANSIGSFVTSSGKSFFNTTLNITTSIFSAVFNFILGLVFAIYMLLQKEKLIVQVKKILYAFISEKRVPRILEIASISNRIFSKFVTVQLMEACIIGGLCFIGMTIFQMPYATMISSLVGLTSLIPVVGAFIGTAVGACLIFMISPIEALWFVLFIIVLQQLEGNIIYPKVVGKQIGLPGIWVLAAVTIGGSLNGVIGMLISVPLCSVLYILLRDTVDKRLRKKEIKVID